MQNDKMNVGVLNDLVLSVADTHNERRPEVRHKYDIYPSVVMTSRRVTTSRIRPLTSNSLSSCIHTVMQGAVENPPWQISSEPPRSLGGLWNDSVKNT